MKSPLIVAILLLLVITPIPPTHGQTISFTVSGGETVRRAAYGYLKWTIPTRMGTTGGGYIEFTLGGNASRATAKQSGWSASSIRRSENHHYYIPPKYMNNGNAKCLFENDRWCRIVIWPLINSQGGTKTAEFKAISARDTYGTPVDVSGKWTLKIKDDNDSF